MKSEDDSTQEEAAQKLLDDSLLESELDMPQSDELYITEVYLL
jgi:hypothetical protein